MNYLNNKKILLIICGGISAYKSLDLIRLLKKNGSSVKTILTKSAEKFVTPLSVVSLSQEKIYTDIFDYNNETVMLAPAAGFYSTKNIGNNQVRIAYVLNTDSLKKAVRCLHEALKVYPGRINLDA